VLALGSAGFERHESVRRTHPPIPLRLGYGSVWRPRAPHCGRILQTAFAGYGMTRNVDEFQNRDTRYILNIHQLRDS
jgi:hypothetical protein